MAVSTARPVLRRGPDGRDYNMKSNVEFKAWEDAWSAYWTEQGYPNGPFAEQGAKAEELPAINVERQSKPGANLPADPIKNAREQEAIEFIRDYTGRFPFILDLRARRGWGTKWYSLSERQVDAVLRVKANENKPAKVREQTGRDLTVLPYGRTHAAVENGEGGVTFFIFDRPEVLDRNKQPNKWHGWVFVKQFIGGIGEGQRLGSQRPGETYTGQWANLVDKVIADPMAAVKRFGHELGICGVCALPLTNEESRREGIGPVCRGRMESGE